MLNFIVKNTLFPLQKKDISGFRNVFI